MDVTVGKHRENLLDTLVREGRFSSANEVVEEGLRLVEAQEHKLQWLRAKLQAAIDEGGHCSDAEIDSALDAAERRLKAEGL